MKTTSFMLRFIIICVCLTLPVFLYSQDFETQPDRNVPYMRFSENVYACQRPVRANIPLITNMVAAVNVDTLHKTLQQLQNWGSRFMLNENRKEIATWLMNKFLSYGYTDVKLDSFYNIVNWNNIYIDSTWQYNVVCTLHGSSASDEIYVIGGHYDSYSDPDPYIDAPGVDNNGSGTAATLEIARVMANLNFHPEATIRFVLFAAEELGMFGSQYDAQKARLEGNDIRFLTIVMLLLI
ncbi:MAG: M20/M25/M40 family metallo-hydrolase [Bacteroidales bacterium]|nr:M20/M25/M40 family metallo-hydrolase [Bacteroidales bacterium]